MTDDQEFLVLKFLYDNKDKSFDEKELLISLDNQIGRNDLFHLLTDFHKREFTDPDIRDTKISPIGTNRYLFLLSLRQDQTKKAKDTKTNKVIEIGNKILSIILLISTAILSWLIWTDKQEIKQKDNTIQQQQLQLDNLQLTIDSLKIIPTVQQDTTQ